MCAATADPLIGRSIGSYRVERRLGEGGMGSVYELVHPGIGKRLAVKILHPELAARPDVVKRFFDEARAVNLIHHPNIVDVLDFGALDDGRPYLTMELLPGESLAERMRARGAMEPAAVLPIARQIASALAAAHRAGIIHRDLKPDNVFLVPRDDGGDAVKVLDFGIAKLLVDDTGRAGERTASGVVMGTPAYMAPEQAMGRTAEIDARSDVYALGVMLFEMLSGALPYRADSLAALLAQHATAEPPSLASLRPELPRGWTALVDRSLSRAPERRFASMDAVATALEAAGKSRARRRAGGRRTAVLLATALALGTAAMLVVLRRGYERRRSAPLATTVAVPVPVPPAPAPVPPQVDPTVERRVEPTVERRVEPTPVPMPSPGRREKPKRDTIGSPAEAGAGVLKVVATPWAKVTVDGVDRGQTPVTLELAAGRHRIVLRNEESGRTVRREAIVRAGQTAMVSVSFD